MQAMKRLALLTFAALIGLVAGLPPTPQVAAQKADPPVVKKHARGRIEPKNLQEIFKRQNAIHLAHLKALPKITAASYDCRALGIVPPIVDQGQCLPPDTPILMTNGEWKRIADLRAGELVVTAEGNTARVTDNTKRWVDEFLVFFRAGDYELLITTLHPVLTIDGYRRAEQLGMGQLVLKRNKADDHSKLVGTVYSPINSLSKQHYKGWVWTLEVSGDHSYVANHIGVHNCGSCWDFSGTSICTSALIAAGAGKPDGSFMLSEQYTLDCGSNGGCDGDDNTTVTAWAKATGLPTTADYGNYTASAGKCKSSSSMKLYKILDWGFCTTSNTTGVAAVQDIKNAMVAHGPIGCAVAAGGGWWDSGTGTDTGTSSGIDHDVVLVGWDDAHDNGDGSKGAWIMRNSWGTSWGVQGYGWMKYGADQIGTEAIWVTAGAAPAPPTPPTPVPPGPVPPTPVPPGPTPTPGTANVQLNAQQVLDVIAQSGKTVVTKDTTIAQLLAAMQAQDGQVTITRDTTVQQLLEAIEKCKTTLPQKLPTGPPDKVPLMPSKP